MNQDFYDDYMNTVKGNITNWDINEEFQHTYQFVAKNYPDVFADPNKKVLDLGSGLGNLAYYIEQHGFNDYTGIDVSQVQLDIAKKRFPKYKFIKQDIIDFLKTNKDKYDIIYLSHVFEHLTLDEGIEVLELIKNTLTDDGIFLNIMPNAGAYFNATSARYIVTHERIYNSFAFSQVLTKVGFSHIEHRNAYIGKNAFFHGIHKIFLKLFEMYIKILGYHTQKYYTTSLITIIKK